MPHEIHPIKRLIFALTTHCNLTCRECVAGIPLISCPEHYQDEYIRYAASCFFGIEHITISGGEPMVHPRFRQIVSAFKKMFGCYVLSLVTNAYKAAEYIDVLHHFDSIVVSHYQNNHREVKFITDHFKDSNHPGPTLHVCTARRARHPIPCSRAYQIKYMYGRLYPCCAIPNGLEGIGISLTTHWRDEICRIPLPCEFCCFAEEKFPETDFDFADIAKLPERTRRHGTRKSIWPDLRPDIEMYGLDLDSWMGNKAFIRCHPDNTNRYLIIRLESHAPIHFHPITLTLKDEHRSTVHCHIVDRPETSEMHVNLSQISSNTSGIILKLICDTTFIPSQVNLELSDSRELGVRIVSLWYK